MVTKLSFALVVGITNVALAQPCAQTASHAFTSAHFVSDVIGRYPELDTREFQDWISVHGGISRWHETRTPAGHKVIIETSDDKSIIFFNSQIEGLGSRITTPQFRLLDERSGRAETLDRALRQATPDQSVTIRPEVRRGNVVWEVDLRDKALIERFQFERKQGLQPKEILRFTLATSTPVAAPVEEELASDELHHLGDFSNKGSAIQAATNLEKARFVYDFVRKFYNYGEVSDEMYKFTFADTLVRFELPAKDGSLGTGLCDELAVVVISYLRALNVRSRMRYLTSSRSEPHAFVEFEGDDVDPVTQQKKWHHLDVVFGFDTPQIYCIRHMRNVLVMLAEKPDDSRSTADCYGLPDITGDSKLCPYVDLELTPCPPGGVLLPYSDCND